MEFSIARLGVRALAPLSETTHARLESFDYVLSWNVVFHGTMGDVGPPPRCWIPTGALVLLGWFFTRRALRSSSTPRRGSQVRTGLVWGFSCQAVVLGCADSFLFG